jgi:hypothetical protein
MTVRTLPQTPWGGGATNCFESLPYSREMSGPLGPNILPGRLARGLGPSRDPIFLSKLLLRPTNLHCSLGGPNQESRTERLHLDILRVAEVVPGIGPPVRGQFVAGRGELGGLGGWSPK